jgi:epoxyqueuosine reductase
VIDKKRYTRFIKEKAVEFGFLYCGISKAEFLADEAPRLEKWLKNGFQGKMSYMENHFDKRLNPALLVEGSKSVITLLYNYFPESTIPHNEYTPKISKYAYGEDYHYVIKDKLKLFLSVLQEEIGKISGRIFVDSAPVMEKAWAKRSGAGWIGKHTNLINPKTGSFFFIAELIIDLELEYDGPIKDFCGTCTKCIDACPTEAIVAPYQLDGSKCISYLTIELKDQLIPNTFKGKMENWAFGCDICQDVCPWNRFSIKHSEPRFLPNDKIVQMNKTDWEDLTEDVFGELFRNSPVKRAKFSGFKRNLNFLKP